VNFFKVPRLSDCFIVVLEMWENLVGYDRMAVKILALQPAISTDGHSLPKAQRER
jgi:hypothetical protein